MEMWVVSLAFLAAAATARTSPGCGKSPPVYAGQKERLSIWVREPSYSSGWASRDYWLCMPAAYREDVGSMLVLDFHGFYDNAKSEREEDHVTAFVDQHSLNVVTVYPHGSGDGYSGDSHGWNVEGNGLNTEPGPEGHVCLTPRGPNDGWNDVYACYNSCLRSSRGCDSHRGCNFASCLDDRGFARHLVHHLSHRLCLDFDHLHVTGISAGALMAYQVALDLADVVASVAPIAGSRVWGFNSPPAHAVHLLDVHGYDDVYVPANRSNGFDTSWPGASLSHDRFWYHEVPTITAEFAKRGGGCDRTNLPHPTKFDGTRGFVCNRPHGVCPNGLFVGQCVGWWGHTWPLHNTHPFAYADLVLSWFRSHPKLRPDGASVPAWLLAPPDTNGTSGSAPKASHDNE